MVEKEKFIERLYFHELERKQSLEGMFSLPAGVIAGLFGLEGYFFTHFNFVAAKLPGGYLLEVMFLFASAASFVNLVLASWWCAKAVIGSEYEHLPGAKTMTDYWESLEDWHRQNTKKSPEKGAELDFEVFLIQSMASCCQKNWKTNLYRSQELYRAKSATVSSLFLVAILSLCYYINFWFYPVSP